LKLIVTIPALNEEETIASVIREIPRDIHRVHNVEVLVLDDGSRDRTVEEAYAAGADYVISNGTNRGLAFTFRRVLDEALARGADVIVNTDADNHYDQTRIPELISPILDNEADIVVGSRVLDKLEMRWGNKQGNRLANFVMQRLLHVRGIDVSSGYRAYSRLAALSLNVLSTHTYTHETLFAAVEKRLKVVTLPLEARHVDRPSRLISSLPKHIWRAGIAVLQSILRYKPFYAYASLGAFLVFLGMIPFVRFLFYWSAGHGQGQLQSLAVGIVFAIIGGQLVVVGLLAKAIAWNRQLMEDMLYRVRRDAAALPSRRDLISLPREDAAYVTTEAEETEPAIQLG
jgi:glycosyltransferase involved in cell wall biosynthesis